MDIILGRARRPRSDEEKRAIVAETMVEGETVSSVARRHGINANMLFTWRKRFRLGDAIPATGTGVPDFLPVAMKGPAPVHEMADRPVIELDFESGARLRIFSAADPRAVKAVIEAMTRV
jgi:transposase